MDSKHRSGLSTALKRQRDPLSDTEDNVPSSGECVVCVTNKHLTNSAVLGHSRYYELPYPVLEVNDVQKRRRLKLLGEENVSPNKSSSSRDHLCCAELEVKPDTPALCSVRSRVQQLTQRREGKRITPPPKITNSEPVYSIDRIRIWQYPCNTQICSH